MADSGATFNHAMIYVQRIEPALRFYRDRLGFRLIESFRWKGRAVYARLRAPRGNSSIALHLPEGKDAPNTRSGIRLYFEVKNLEQLCARLKRAGVKFSQMPKRMPWGWKHAYLKDPEGYELSLYWAGPKRLRKSVMKS
jgi:catechol 2,3-dioxygenase-like lactoylglutathione lyase family enzyme